MRISQSVFWAMLIAAPLALNGQALTPVERKMQAYVEQHLPEEIAFLARTVDINSGTMNHAGVRAVGDEFARELNALCCRWMPKHRTRRGFFRKAPATARSTKPPEF